MSRRKGFTLVELLVVVFVVGILAAIAIPIVRSRIDAAKWTEGKATAGTLASSLRVYCAGLGESDLGDPPALSVLGLLDSDLKGKYFDRGNYSWTTGYDAANNRPYFTVTIHKPEKLLAPDRIILDESGSWMEEYD